jgi:hypothetical protein
MTAWQDGDVIAMGIVSTKIAAATATSRGVLLHGETNFASVGPGSPRREPTRRGDARRRGHGRSEVPASGYGLQNRPRTPSQASGRWG